MLILTESALDRYATVPDWDGPRVVVLSPERVNEISLPEGTVVAEYLQPPTSATQLLCDLTRWLRPRLAENSAPLLFLDRSADTSEIRRLAERARSQSKNVETEWEGDRLVMLSVSAAVAETPLLPEFFDFLCKRGLSDDTTMIRLLGETFDWN